MPRSVNFDNGPVERFNIDLDPQGNLNFNANGTDGNGNRRLQINDDSGQLTIGGSGQFAALQLLSATNGNVVFVGSTATQATALLGGGNSGQNGVVRLGNAAGQDNGGHAREQRQCDAHRHPERGGKEFLHPAPARPRHGPTRTQLT